MHSHNHNTFEQSPPSSRFSNVDQLQRGHRIVRLFFLPIYLSHFYLIQSESNDALRQQGIIPQLPVAPPTPSPPPSPTLSDLNLSDLSDFEDEFNIDEEVQRTIAGLKRRKEQEKRAEDKKGWRYGRVYPIGREMYTREVTDASLEDQEGDPEGSGTGVICFLYKDGYVTAFIFSLLPLLTAPYAVCPGRISRNNT